MEPLYVTKPGGTRWVNWVLASLLILTVAMTVGLLLLSETIAALVTGGSLLATVALIWFILPVRYEVWPDRLRLVFPVGGWNIPFDTIQTVRHGLWYEAYGFIGIRFATAPSSTVTILRNRPSLFKRPNLVISPLDRDEFMRQLQRAMEAHRRAQTASDRLPAG